MFIFIFFNISVFQILYIQYLISNMLSQIRNLGLKFNFSFNQIRTSTSLNTIDKLNIYHYGKKTKKNNQLKNITDICSKEKMNNNLSNQDPVLDQLIKDEYQRQCQSIELIASENYTSLGVIGSQRMKPHRNSDLYLLNKVTVWFVLYLFLFQWTKVGAYPNL